MPQIQLSDAQAVILSTACAREDGAIFPVTASLKGGAVGNVCKSLLKHGLIQEVEATNLDTVWRHDENHGPITLRATPLAYTTLGITSEPDETQPADAPSAAVPRRTATKQETLIGMLRAEGARDRRRDRRGHRMAAAHNPWRHLWCPEEEARPRGDVREGRTAWAGLRHAIGSGGVNIAHLGIFE